MKRLEHMKECLMATVENQMTHLEQVDTKELGEAVDMIKDLAEAIYYCTITEAMHQKEKGNSYHTEEKMYYPYPMYYGENGGGQMYYDEPMSNKNNNNHHMETKGNRNETMRDEREGRSPRSRRMYMESKEQHHDKAAQMKELENYMQELTSDIVEMVEGSTQEEKQYLSKRVAALANKLAQLND